MSAATRYRSGFCGGARHEACRGSYSTAVCGCPCHDVVLARVSLPAPPTVLDALGTAYGLDAVAVQVGDELLITRPSTGGQ